MQSKAPQDVASELDYQARQARLHGEVQATPAATLQRYRQHKRWRIFAKEFLFLVIARHQPQCICDFGCGAGETSTELGALGYRVTGFDLSPDLIVKAQRRAELDGVQDRVQFRIANARDSELNKGAFDLVLVVGVLHHVDVAECLEELLLLLKPGGIALIIEPIAFSPLLQRLRDLIPIAKDISPNERQLSRADIQLVENRLEILERRFFHFFGRLIRLVPQRIGWLYWSAAWVLGWIDYLTLTCFPPLRHFAGTLVLVCRKHQDAHLPKGQQ